MWEITLIFIIWPCVFGSTLIDTNNYEKLRYCVAKNTHKQKNHQVNLTILNNNNDHIEYIVVNERSSCLRLLITGGADFTVCEPEDLVINYLHHKLESPILVTHELRSTKQAKTRFEMVVLVSKNIQSFSDLENKRFCHPGYDSDLTDWTRTFANYFQSWIFPRQCDSDKTLFENEISLLSTHFEAACIAGPWTFDAKKDSELKLKYRNLCALCDNPHGCYSTDKYHGREGALLCLTDGVGDIAWVRLEDTLNHFQVEKIDKNSFNYLCPDGLSRSMNNNYPCVWITKPWPVITARREIAEKVTKKMESLSTSKTSWKDDFLEQLENYHVVPINTDIIKTPGDYLSQFNGFASAYSRSACYPSRTVKWCVASSLENRKCQWIRDVAFSSGIEPTISCHQQLSRNACIEAVQNGICDFFLIKPEEIMVAHKKNLSSIVQLVSKKSDDLNTYAIVVKDDSKYYNLEDLQGARACFTDQQSIEWNAFIAIMRNQTKGLAWHCSGDKAVTQYFQSIIFNRPDDNNNENIDLYEKNNNNHADKETILIDNTYNCLISGKGDVAFVNLNTKNSSYRSQHRLRNICIDHKPNDCILSWSTLGMIVVNQNMSELRRDEIHEMLMQLNSWFSSKFVGQAPAFSLYGPFDSHRNVIFPEKTQSLQEDVSYIRLPRNYENILRQLEDFEIQPNICSEASSCAIVKIILILSYFVTYISYL